MSDPTTTTARLDVMTDEDRLWFLATDGDLVVFDPGVLDPLPDDSPLTAARALALLVARYGAERVTAVVHKLAAETAGTEAT
jgi:hypothetical protein